MHEALSLVVNGEQRSLEVEPRTLLVHALRDSLGLTGTHVGCDTSQCGACTVLLDGVAVKSCTVLALQAAGAEVTTIEGFAPDGELHPIQRAFVEHHGLQCGFCTPGMILTAADLPDIPPKSRNTLFLARGRVIFAGQPVALVLAETPAAAQDGAEQVWVEYESQTAVITISEALAPGAPLVWPGGKPGASGEAGAHGADVAGVTQ